MIRKKSSNKINRKYNQINKNKKENLYKFKIMMVKKIKIIHRFK